MDLLISQAGLLVLATEMDLKVPGSVERLGTFFTELYAAEEGQITVYGKQDWMAPIASGSAVNDVMVVCPCTTGSLGAIANGQSDNLIERAADVTLKEGKSLILAVREMPLSQIHLENMLKLARMGVTIMPLSPAFYHRPKEIMDLVDFAVARILDHLKIPTHLATRWGSQK
jgi:flavin prenyltransferase